MWEASMAAGPVPFREVDQALDCGSMTSAISLLSCAVHSSSRTLRWERLMKSGLDLCNASCQNQEHIDLPDKTLKANAPFPRRLWGVQENCSGSNTYVFLFWL